MPPTSAKLGKSVCKVKETEKSTNNNLESNGWGRGEKSIQENILSAEKLNESRGLGGVGIRERHGWEGAWGAKVLVQFFLIWLHLRQALGLEVGHLTSLSCHRLLLNMTQSVNIGSKASSNSDSLWLRIVQELIFLQSPVLFPEIQVIGKCRRNPTGLCSWAFKWRKLMGKSQQWVNRMLAGVLIAHLKEEVEACLIREITTNILSLGRTPESQSQPGTSQTQVRSVYSVAIV